jgi:hypothetical protein
MTHAKRTYLYLQIVGSRYAWSLEERADSDVTTLEDFRKENPGAAERIQNAIRAGLISGLVSVLPSSLLLASLAAEPAAAPLFATKPGKHRTFTLAGDGIATAQGPAWTGKGEAFRVLCSWPNADMDGGVEHRSVILTREHIRALAALEKATSPQEILGKERSS